MAQVALLDCNNFFVSCERLFRPDLENKPVVVLSNNDGCVVARSKEIKDIGIPMGVPYFQVKDILSDISAAVFSSNFALYRDISRRVLAIVREEYSIVEQYSIDECFIELNLEKPVDEMQRLKDRIKKEIGIPVSIGIASSKTQAKYASKLAKSGIGVLSLSVEDFNGMSSRIKLSEIWGVGQSSAVKFSKDNLVTVSDLLALNELVVKNKYGVHGSNLWAELMGRYIHVIKDKQPIPKSVMSTRSFKETLVDKKIILDSLWYHLHQVVKEMVKMNLLACKIKITISPGRYSDYVFYGKSKEVVLIEPTADLIVLNKVVKEALDEIYMRGIPYKKTGVIISKMIQDDGLSKSLFTKINNFENEHTARITKTLLDLNRVLGNDVVQIGRVTKSKTTWKNRQDTLSPLYTTSWRDIKKVKT